jgi:hypothetical protein
VILSLNVHQHLWNSDLLKHVIEEQIVQKEVHGSMEASVRADGQNDQQVSHDGVQVNGQEQVEKEGLKSKVICHSQENKFRNSCFVSGFHDRDET